MGSIDSESVQPSVENLNYHIFQSNIKDFVIFVLLVTLVLSILGINIFIYIGNLIQYITDLFKPLMASIGYISGVTINKTADLAGDTAKFGVDVAEGTVHDIGNLMIAASDKNAIPDYEEQYQKTSASIFEKVGNAIKSGISTIPSFLSNYPPANLPLEEPEPTTISTTTTTFVPEQPQVPPIPPQYFGMTPMGANMPITFPVTITIPIPVPINISTTPTMNIEKTIESPPPAYAKEVATDTSESTIQSPIAAKKTNWCLIGEYKDRKGCVELDDADRCISGQVFPSKQMCMNPIFNLDSSYQDVFKSPADFVATDDRGISANQVFVS